MALIDEILEVGRCPVAAGRREVADDLVAPRLVEGVLHDRQQLDVGEPHVFGVGDQFVGDLPEIHLVGAPRVQMELVDRHRRAGVVRVVALRQPFIVTPGVVELVRHDRSRLRPQLHATGEGIALDVDFTIGRLDLELVEGAGGQSRHEELPHARRAARAHRVVPAIPAVEVADDADPPRGGGPDGETDAGTSVHAPQMGAELVIYVQVGALAEQVEVEVAQQRREGVRIGGPVEEVASAGELELVGEGHLVIAHGPLEEAVRVDGSQRITPSVS